MNERDRRSSSNHNQNPQGRQNLVFIFSGIILVTAITASLVTFALLKQDELFGRINATPSPTATPTPASAASPTPTPTPTATESPTPTPTPTPTLAPPSSASSPAPDPGNTMGQALNLGILKDTRTYNDFVGSVDVVDYYRFQLDTTSNVAVNLSSLNAYTHVELILDRNTNGQVDNGEVLYQNARSSSASIGQPLGAGTYFIRVYPDSRNENTTYTIEVAATPVGTK
ncbi:pre-peptidase C-terminal domain-containing protein [Microcoleus sp. FACHB-831]|uniref:pre-peptidase C-terminal domain-containing protein n=1 Tax=Microcoleus sp. FACHB-831 TaxID=2692827 RepID=UPI0016873E17|nr:pre-peptidase C-terminal domain-containing protein [Microcoleus sp. FACHB-831]MBD1921124.1 pre-peptidase C-terminal domain-containing protein [Microcoleus sp. FACHB-831]